MRVSQQLLLGIFSINFNILKNKNNIKSSYFKNLKIKFNKLLMADWKGRSTFATPVIN